MVYERHRARSGSSKKDAGDYARGMSSKDTVVSPGQTHVFSLPSAESVVVTFIGSYFSIIDTEAADDDGNGVL